MATTTGGNTATQSPSIQIVSTGGGSATPPTNKIVHIGIPGATVLEGSNPITAIRRHELLARQPSYCKILNELKEVDTEETKESLSDRETDTSSSPLTIYRQTDRETDTSPLTMKDEVIELPEPAEVSNQAPTVVINGQPYQIVTPAASAATDTIENVISISNSTGAGQFSNSSTVFVASGSSSTVNHQAEEQARKRAIRLLKNREAAKECRNKKKEYIKCLENRVAVLENQNKALIEELKLLKERVTVHYKSSN